MKKYKWGALVLVVGVAIGYMARPEPEVRIVEKVVKEKQVEEKIVMVERPDGTKVTTIDRSSHERSESDKMTHKTPAKKDWAVAAHKSILDETMSVSISRRVLGDIYIGLQSDVKEKILIGVTVLF